MEVRFFLTNDDLWQFQKYALTRPRTLRALAVIFIIIPVLIIALAFLNTSETSSSVSSFMLNVLPIPLLFLLVLLLLLISPRWLRRASTNRRLMQQGQHIVTISPEGFHLRNNLATSLISWQAFKEITTDKHSLYFIQQSNRLVANIVPRRAFATPQDADAFLAWARQYQAGGPVRLPVGPAEPSATYERWG